MKQVLPRLAKPQAGLKGKDDRGGMLRETIRMFPMALMSVEGGPITPSPGAGACWVVSPCPSPDPGPKLLARVASICGGIHKAFIGLLYRERWLWWLLFWG